MIALFLERDLCDARAPQDALPEIERVGSPATRMFLYAIAYYALGRKKEPDAALKGVDREIPGNFALSNCRGLYFPQAVRRSVRVARPGLCQAS